VTRAPSNTSLERTREGESAKLKRRRARRSTQPLDVTRAHHMTASTLELALIQVLEAAWNDGSPVAGSTLENRAKVAATAIRRINSFSRRGVPEGNHPRQVADLAKGLVAQLEARPHLVGPLIKDYEHVAGLLLNSYRGIVATSNTSLERTREG
jgi:hypothetical protein